MQPHNKPLMSLTASELMSAAVMAVSEEMSLPTAAHLLAQAHVTGAPVVNSQGKCVGVISSSDFLRWADKSRRHEVVHDAASELCLPWQLVEPEHLPCEAVRNFMTRDPVVVAPHTTIGSLARMMIDAHIHRLIVVDSAGRPTGIISSTDVLAAVARADQAPPAKEAGYLREAAAC
jgi:CBS-domain-containing membrane protein